MTDQASSGLSTPEAPHSTNSADLPHWTTFARAHDWKRASASASLTHADSSVQGALSALSSFQEDVRGKRYLAAKKALSAYQQHLSALAEHSAGDAALLQSLAAPDTLASALDALEQAAKAHTPEELAPLLPAAQQHALTAAEAHNIRGVMHALREEPQDAQHAFETALEADPQHYRARMNLGNLALEAGDPLAAEAHYREVLKLAPDYDGAHHNLGVALRRQGKLGDSVKAIRRGQRLGTQRTRQQDREEIEEQMRQNPRLRQMRVVVIAVVVAVVALMIFLGRHG